MLWCRNVLNCNMEELPIRCAPKGIPLTDYHFLNMEYVTDDNKIIEELRLVSSGINVDRTILDAAPICEERVKLISDYDESIKSYCEKRTKDLLERPLYKIILDLLIKTQIPNIERRLIWQRLCGIDSNEELKKRKLFYMKRRKNVLTVLPYFIPSYESYLTLTKKDELLNLTQAEQTERHISYYLTMIREIERENGRQKFASGKMIPNSLNETDFKKIISLQLGNDPNSLGGNSSPNTFESPIMCSLDISTENVSTGLISSSSEKKIKKPISPFKKELGNLYRKISVDIPRVAANYPYLHRYPMLVSLTNIFMVWATAKSRYDKDNNNENENNDETSSITEKNIFGTTRDYTQALTDAIITVASEILFSRYQIDPRNPSERYMLPTELIDFEAEVYVILEVYLDRILRFGIQPSEATELIENEEFWDKLANTPSPFKINCETSLNSTVSSPVINDNSVETSVSSSTLEFNHSELQAPSNDLVSFLQSQHIRILNFGFPWLACAFSQQMHQMSIETMYSMFDSFMALLCLCEVEPSVSEAALFKKFLRELMMNFLVIFKEDIFESYELSENLQDFIQDGLPFFKFSSLIMKKVISVIFKKILKENNITAIDLTDSDFVKDYKIKNLKYEDESFIDKF